MSIAAVSEVRLHEEGSLKESGKYKTDLSRVAIAPDFLTEFFESSVCFANLPVVDLFVDFGVRGNDAAQIAELLDRLHLW
uniref:Type VI secretion system contractile sheath large subunit n=1 Tax=Loa loa TaxID=7209 RepID=A0A1I7VKZ0_LOALO